MKFELRRLSPADGTDVHAILQTQPKDENGFINDAHGISAEEFPAWLQKQHDISGGIGLADWMVPQTTYWFLLDGQMVGFGKFRHRLTDALRKTGGNIGYCIFPEFRGRRYARAFLQLMIDEMRRQGIEEILFTVHRDNTASIRAAENCGARRIKEDGERVYLSIENKPPVLIILRGNSGSGKTTLAHKLQRKLGRGTLVISQDVVRRTMLYAADGHGTQAIPLLIEMIRYGRAHCDHVILEGILDAEVYQPLFEVCLREFERIHAYYYDITFEETLRRHETKPNHADFGEADMRRWWKEKDFIGIIAEQTLTADMTHEDAIRKILSDLAK